MTEVVVHTWNELQETLFAGAWQPGIARLRSPYVFRGMQDARYPLESSLARLGDDAASLEPHLLRNFRKYARRDVVEQDTLWHWLSLAQHHGLPTRLLDWTVSPLVAAHFATADIEQYGVDGVIWAVDQVQAHRLVPKKLHAELEKEGADYFTVEMLARAVPSLPALDHLAPPPFVLFFEPPSIDDRIVNQFALFSVMPGPLSPLGVWLVDYPDLWRKIIIPASLKWDVRDRLDQANITERVLFPGLDGLSKWQKRYYTPRKKE